MLKCIPLCPIILCIMSIICLTTSMAYYNYTGISPGTQLIVAGQVITQPMLAPSWLDTLWYEGVSIHHRHNGLSDNLAMLISVVNAEDIDVITHKELVCDMYPANETVYNENGEVTTKRTIFPLNYLVNPMYFVRESSIVLLLHIYLPSVVNNLHKATLYIFNSDDKVQRFLSGERNVKPIGVMDVSGIARKEESLYYYNVVEDGYLFFVVELNTSANYFTLFSNITSELNSYIITGDTPNNMSHSTFGLNGSVFFQFTSFSPPKKMIFLYAHPVEDLELPLTHLILTYRPRSGFKILVVVLLSCVIAVCLVCSCICICINLKKKNSCPKSYERLI